jgi:hypothetical protein
MSIAGGCLETYGLVLYCTREIDTCYGIGGSGLLLLGLTLTLPVQSPLPVKNMRESHASGLGKLIMSRDLCNADARRCPYRI